MTTPYEEGSKNSPICLLGEAPSTEEMKKGQPFVGQAGRVLDDLLLAAGISRADCYITNCYEQPVKKDIQGKIKEAPSGLFVDRLAACTSNVIVPLGNTALRAMAPSTKGAIGKWRGSIIPATLSGPLEGRKLVSTYHPATVCWGNTHARHIIAGDLQRVKEQSAFPDFRLNQRLLHTEPTFVQVMDFIDHCGNQPNHVFWDVELYAGCLSAISFSCSPLESMSIPFINEDRQNWWNVEQEFSIFNRIGKLLGDVHVPKGNQNISFDIWIMWQLYGMSTRGRLDDPMILHHIVYPDFDKGLDFLCSTLTDQPYYKDDGGSRLWADPWKDLKKFWRYSALDACIALECFQALQKTYLTPESPWLRSYENTLTLIEPLVFMELRGMKIDLNKLRQERFRLTKALRETEEKLALLAPGLNYASPKQCVDYFYAQAGIDPYVNKKTGRPTTNDLALSRLARKGNVAAQLVLDCRGYKKSMGNYEEVKTAGGRLHCSYNIRGTKTDRLSSSASVFGDGGNMQNLPAEFLDVLVVD